VTQPWWRSPVAGSERQKWGELFVTNGLTLEQMFIAARYVNGESAIALAQLTGISRYQINRILAQAGVKRRPSPNIATLSDATKKWIVRLYAAGSSVAKIGRELGLEASLVATVVRLEGLDPKVGGPSGQAEPPETQPGEGRTYMPYVDPPEEPPEPTLDAPTEEVRRIAYGMVAAYQQGKSLQEIAERFGYPMWRVVRILKSARVTLVVEAREQPPTAAVDVGLTPRQLEILRLMDIGWSNPEIGAYLKVSASLIRHESMKIYPALGVHSRLEAVNAARGLGILSPPAEQPPDVDGAAAGTDEGTAPEEADVEEEEKPRPPPMMTSEEEAESWRVFMEAVYEDNEDLRRTRPLPPKAAEGRPGAAAQRGYDEMTK
jgi:DNA-binding CsgD family transcriptional regulator